ncbi:MAG TPA: SCO family protein [Vicinamibacterales bacterium]|nr:SCO family protein [Vicinamibacterales bacterium]
MKTPISLVLAFVAAVPGFVSAQAKPGRHTVRGMVLSVDAARKTVVVSHDSIPGVMAAMAMPFDVRNARELEGVVPGAIVSFTLVIAKESSHAEGLRVVRYESVEQDPITARRLRLLQTLTGGDATAPSPVRVGQAVPDFTLTDQAHARVSLSQFRGKVVALNFIYTSCALPQFCYRLANHFSVVQRRLQARMGRDLVLLTVTFDPARDTPERLAEYAGQWKADPSVWHFLTGSVEDVKRVCRLFGLDAFPDEGLINHSTRTVVVDRRGVLAASIEGNQHTAAQLEDLVDGVLRR